ncbi:AfsR/SARP family transcriptional regulator [Streptomyces sp. I05A-00742]|uniref:AfsR/SARP family transcriptional regulator n=1 Tax=Streptomyces sp. I05A-00742 TaxID=2732853 RepID=UPI0014891E51|nr:AfsR/SARP family transcriptional regulator [Streptomyces sp. I05A-00742]
MDVGILGPLRIRVHGQSVVPSAAKPRKILALLALGAGRMVRVEDLVEELWEQSPPRSAMTTLQTYIMQLRNLLRRAGAGCGTSVDPKDVLETRTGGYRLNLDGGSRDIDAFDRFARMGYDALKTGDPHTARHWLRTALDLWCGSALEDVMAGPILQGKVVRLHEARLSVLEQRITADLQLERYFELTGELTELASQHPLNEKFHEQLMVVLHRTGRRSQALEVYQRLRGNLVEQLGMEPAAPLRRLQQALLHSDSDVFDSSVRIPVASQTF